ncbi:MAG: glycosyltransferase [Candidatus Wallbacteria bacterium]|nr:glycosyltransferase [Candidatus Wallbacteria bacterium]
MKILMALPELSQGGVEQYVFQLAPRLCRLGIQITVVSSGGPLADQLLRMDVEHIEMNLASKSPLSFMMIPRLRRLIRREKFDLVHAHSRVPGWLLYYAASGLCPFVYSPHGQYRPHWGSSIVKKPAHLIVGAEFLRDYFRDQFSVPESRFKLVPYGVDLGKYYPGPQKRKDPYLVELGAAGRLSVVKGFDMLLKALAVLVGKGIKNFNLRLAGSGEERDRLEKMIRELGISSRVALLGNLTDMRPFYRSLDCLVISSRREGLPLVLLEAMACGLPAIATTVGDIPRVITEGVEG